MRPIGNTKVGTRKGAKKAPVPQVSGCAILATHGRHISMEVPDSGGRLPHNFKTMGATPYL